MKNFLIDVGSSFIKYYIYDVQLGEVILQEKIPFPEANVCEDKKYTVSTQKIHNVIVDIFNIALKHSCKRAFLSVQMHGYILKDDSGFSDYVSWRDQSGKIESLYEFNIDFKNRGTSLKSNLPFVKLCTEGRDYSNVEFFTLGSYISYILTGQNETHITDAAASGLYNLQTLETEIFPLNGLITPRADKEVRVVGKYKDMDIYSPCGDHQISFKGINKKQFVLINIGTATQISALDETSSEKSYIEGRPYFNNYKLQTISGLVGGYELFNGNGYEKLIDQIELYLGDFLEEDIVFAGGGAKLIFDRAKKHLKKYGYTCELFERNAGLEGLINLANEERVEIGTMVSEVPYIHFPLIFKNNNIDFFIIDNEHGAFDYSILSGLVMNAKLSKMTSIIRISDNLRMNITKFSDMGAGGFLLPMTNCAADILPVVNYAKYCPIGKRGISTMRAHTLYNPPQLLDYMQKANQEMKVYAQIETKCGVDNIEEIIAVMGVDGVFIGPNDLACDLNCIGKKEPVIECIVKVAEACKKYKKPWGIITTDLDLINAAKQNGVDFISYGSELNMLNNGCKALKEGI